jgi:hypothetical protein
MCSPSLVGANVLNDTEAYLDDVPTIAFVNPDGVATPTRS